MQQYVPFRVPYKTRQNASDLMKFAWMDDPMPYNDLPIKLMDYNDFISMNVNGKIQPAVLATSEENQYICLQLRYLPNAHLLRAIASNLGRTEESVEAYTWLPIVKACFDALPRRYNGLTMMLDEMASHVSGVSSTVSDLQTFLANWHDAGFSANEEIVRAVLTYNAPALQTLYTLT